MPCNSVKLVDVPEMNYLAVNGEGEVKTNTDNKALTHFNNYLSLMTVFVLNFRCASRVLMCSRAI